MPNSHPKQSPLLILVYPRFRYPSGDYPIGVALLASVVRKELGWRVSIIDTTFNPDMNWVQQQLEESSPDVVGLGLSTLMLGEGLEIADMASALGAKVVVGSAHPSVFPTEMMAHQSIDACVIGEGERPLVNLLRNWQTGIVQPVQGAHVRNRRTGELYVSNERDPVSDLNALPFPAWDLIDMHAYFDAWGQLDSVRPGLRGVNLSGSRGCPFTCRFCADTLHTMFGRKLRQRSPQSLIEELTVLKKRYKIEAFWLTDDTFTTNRKYVEQFCDVLEQSGLNLIWGCTTRANLIPEYLIERMHSVGLRKVGIGLESATERVREGIYNKEVSDSEVSTTVRALHKYGVQTLLFLMLGAPSETRWEMLQTILLSASLPATEASFSLFVPLPGTAVYDQMKLEGYTLSEDYLDYDYYAKQPFEHALSRWELRMWQRIGYARFYASRKRLPSLIQILKNEQGRASLKRKMMRIVPRVSTT